MFFSNTQIILVFLDAMFFSNTQKSRPTGHASPCAAITLFSSRRNPTRIIGSRPCLRTIWHAQIVVIHHSVLLPCSRLVHPRANQKSESHRTTIHFSSTVFHPSIHHVCTYYISFDAEFHGQSNAQVKYLRMTSLELMAAVQFLDSNGGMTLAGHIPMYETCSTSSDASPWISQSTKWWGKIYCSHIIKRHEGLHVYGQVVHGRQVPRFHPVIRVYPHLKPNSCHLHVMY